MADLSALNRRMIEDMTVRNLSPAAQRSNISAFSKPRLVLMPRAPDAKA
jgi:integrase/recombinase XerD